MSYIIPLYIFLFLFHGQSALLSHRICAVHLSACVAASLSIVRGLKHGVTTEMSFTFQGQFCNVFAGHILNTPLILTAFVE